MECPHPIGCYRFNPLDTKEHKYTIPIYLMYFYFCISWKTSAFDTEPGNPHLFGCHIQSIRLLISISMTLQTRFPCSESFNFQILNWVFWKRGEMGLGQWWQCVGKSGIRGVAINPTPKTCWSAPLVLCHKTKLESNLPNFFAPSKKNTFYSCISNLSERADNHEREAYLNSGD